MYTFDEIAIKYNWEKRDNPRENIQRFESYARSHGVYLQWIVGTSKPRKYEILNNPEIWILILYQQSFHLSQCH